jgi:carboxylesterase type B
LPADALEGTLFVLIAYQNPAVVTPADYTDFLEDNYGSTIASIIEQEYPVSAFNSTPYPAFYAMVTIKTKADYFCPAYRALTTANKKDIPVWTYFFDHTPSCSWYNGISAAFLALFGPTHTAEIPFVFGNTDRLPLPNGTCSFTTAEHEISNVLVSAWTSMAAGGQPSPNGGLEWPAYNSSTSLGLQIANSTTIGPVDYSACEFWDYIHELVVNSTGAEAPSNA